MGNVKSITPLPPADFTPEMGNYRTLQPFRYWCQKVLPLVYDDSLSYYELLCKVVDYLNKAMEDVETLHGDVTNLHTAYEELQSYVNNYFNNIDVQEEINNKLDNMASNGELYEIIRRYTDPIVNEQNSKITVLENRMNTFTSLPEGSTSGNAELIDIRVPAAGFNGNKTYPNAGDAVRGQVSELKGDLFNVSTSITFFKSMFRQGDINVNEGVIKPDERYAIYTYNPFIINAPYVQVNIPYPYRLYLSYNDNGVYKKIITSNGADYFENGDISEYLPDVYIYATIAHERFIDITPNVIDNFHDFSCVGVTSTEKTFTTTYSRKGAKLLPTPNDWHTIYSANGTGIVENIFFAGDFDYSTTEIQIISNGIVKFTGFLYELIGLPNIASYPDKFLTDMFGKTGVNGGIYMNYKIPFYNNLEVKIMTRDSSNPYVWFTIKTSKWHDIIINGIKIPFGADLYAIRKYREVDSGQEFTLFEANESEGMVLGHIIQTTGLTSDWYLEGMIRAYVGGSQTPELVCSGLEDYFYGTYYYATGKYYGNICGCTYIDKDKHSYAAYRLHTRDLWRFNRGGYKVTLKNSDINVEESSEILNPTKALYTWYSIYYLW